MEDSPSDHETKAAGTTKLANAIISICEFCRVISSGKLSASRVHCPTRKQVPSTKSMLDNTLPVMAV